MGDDSPASARRLLGRSLRDGRYVISGLLGSGTQGATVEAVDKRNGRLVAIKRFQVRGARTWKDVELAEREARVLSKLSHPLLPRAIEHFEEAGALYLVMERIEGQTLALLHRLERDEVVRFLHCVARILEYLHGRTPPVIHRDIKPSNVIRRQPVAGEGPAEFVVVDFGSVRDSLEPAGGSTVVGTFGYMAPEQFQGRAKPASDVYAVGVCALRMLTGIEPEDLPHRGLAIDVAAALGDGDPALVRALTAMVEPDPDARAGSLEPLLAGLAAPPDDSGKPADRGQADRSDRTTGNRPHPVADAPQRAADEGALETVIVPPLGAATVLGLLVAELAVWAALHVVVPLLLTLLSILFGTGLRRAAAEVRAAGRRARGALRRTRARVRARRPRPGRPRSRRRRDGRQRGPGRRGRRGRRRSAGVPAARGAGAGRQRIDPAPDGPSPKARIEEGIAATIAELEDALDETLEDLEEQPRKRQRRDR